MLFWKLINAVTTLRIKGIISEQKQLYSSALFSRDFYFKSIPHLIQALFK